MDYPTLAVQAAKDGGREPSSFRSQLLISTRDTRSMISNIGHDTQRVAATTPGWYTKAEDGLLCFFIHRILYGTPTLPRLPTVSLPGAGGLERLLIC